MRRFESERLLREQQREIAYPASVKTSSDRLSYEYRIGRSAVVALIEFAGQPVEHRDLREVATITTGLHPNRINYVIAEMKSEHELRQTDDGLLEIIPETLAEKDYRFRDAVEQAAS